MKVFSLAALLAGIAVLLTAAVLVGVFIPVWDLPSVAHKGKPFQWDVLDIDDSTESKVFPCDWTKDYKIMKLADKTLQCRNVGESVSLVYDVSPNDPTDKFTLMLFNQTEYAHYKSGENYACINEPQCRYGDTTTKAGRYNIPNSEPEIIAVVKNSNVVQRAFVKVDLHIHAAKKGFPSGMPMPKLHKKW